MNAEIPGWEAQHQFSKLGELELDNNQADKALTSFPDSILGQALNYHLSTYLEGKGIEQNIAFLVTGWVAWDTYKQIEQLLSYERENVLQSLSLTISAAQEIRKVQKYASIESYLIENISPTPKEPILIERWKVIGEDFTIPEIYVSLEAQLLDSNKLKENKAIVNLENWVKEQLNKPEKNRQVMFIQAGPGRGKSVFCKMFANWVREHLHPIWTPILIRLRDIDTFEPNIENTLRAAVRENFTNCDDWLSDRKTRYLFILDGFDELRFEGRTAKGIEDFLQQVGNYQAQTGCRHRFIVTGRESALHGIENRIPTNLNRLEIALMDDELQNQWLEKWSRLFGQDKAEEFQKFIEAVNCPVRVYELAREPLLLYLLAAMHRDNILTIEMFDDANDAQAKIIIYQETLDWVLTKQRPEKLNQELTEFDTEDLRLILTEAGLCITQSGKEWTSIKTIEERLKSEKSAREMLEKAKQNLGENPLRNALAAFYLRPAKATESTEGAVEFIHKSFGEFLCAQKITENLKKWVRLDSESRRDRFIIDDDKLSEEIYDLLSYGGLTPEIVEYLMALLDSEKQFNYLKLFERLEYFYQDWCRGKFINGSPNNLPLNQMQKFRTANILLDLRQVDIYAGLNVMILLLELYRYFHNNDEFRDKIIFYPCGKVGSNNFDNQLLLRIIGYSNSVTVGIFSETVGNFLLGASLEGVYLAGVHLAGASLDRANLSQANLKGAYLSEANLELANLKSANLSGANLSEASLAFADLEDANLQGANLSKASLVYADLKDANLQGVYLEDASISEANLLRANLEGANLQGANLQGANLSGASLEDANLQGANLEGAYLGRTSFDNEVYLEGANFKGANLTKVTLSGAYLEGANFTRANLEGACFLRFDLSEAKLDEAYLDEAYLEGINIKSIDLD